MVHSLGACFAESTPRVSPIVNNISLKISSEDVLILWATINPSVSALSPALLNNYWVSCKSTSAFWLRRGYWACKGFDLQAVLIEFFPFFLATLFNIRVFSVFVISQSNSVSRSKSILCANSRASFTAECEPFSFSCFKASFRIQSSDKFKYQNKWIVDVYETVQVGSNPYPCYFLGGKDDECQVMHAVCVVIIFLTLISIFFFFFFFLIHWN